MPPRTRMDRNGRTRTRDIAETGVGNREVGGDERKLRKTAHAPRGALVDVRREIKVGDRCSMSRGQTVVLLPLQTDHTGAVLHQRRPQRRMAIARRADDADAGDRDNGGVSHVQESGGSTGVSAALAIRVVARMGDPGFEPGTSSLSERRSNRLS